MTTMYFVTTGKGERGGMDISNFAIFCDQGEDPSIVLAALNESFTMEPEPDLPLIDSRVSPFYRLTPRERVTTAMLEQEAADLYDIANIPA